MRYQVRKANDTVFTFPRPQIYQGMRTLVGVLIPQAKHDQHRRQPCLFSPDSFRCLTQDHMVQELVNHGELVKKR